MTDSKTVIAASLIVAVLVLSGAYYVAYGSPARVPITVTQTVSFTGVPITVTHTLIHTITVTNTSIHTVTDVTTVVSTSTSILTTTDQAHVNLSATQLLDSENFV